MAIHHTIVKLRSTVHDQAVSLTRQYYRNAMLELQIRRKDHAIADLKAQNEILRAKNGLLRTYLGTHEV